MGFNRSIFLKWTDLAEELLWLQFKIRYFPLMLWKAARLCYFNKVSGFRELIEKNDVEHYVTCSNVGVDGSASALYLVTLMYKKQYCLQISRLSYCLRNISVNNQLKCTSVSLGSIIPIHLICQSQPLRTIMHLVSLKISSWPFDRGA